MDFDLFSACVFCASSLFSVDLRPLPGYSGELSGGYTTFQRRGPVNSAEDTSDVTAKFGAVGLAWTRPAVGSLGAGTPAAEFRVRVVFPNTHDESREPDAVPSRILATGSGRYENFTVMGRYALSPRTSIEAGSLHRRFKGTDLVNVGGSFFEFSEQRQLVAEEDDHSLGLRQRWEGLEVAGYFKHTILQGNFNTAKVYTSATGQINGGTLEVRARRGRWTGTMILEGTTGSLGIEGSLPDSGRGTAWMRDAQLRLSYSFGASGKWDVLAAAMYDETRLPFVSLAPLGTETRAFDSGFVADSATRDWHLELVLRVRVTPGYLHRVFFRFSSGSESVSLRDAAGGGRPGTTLSVNRRGAGGVFLLGVAAEFTIGGVPAAAASSP